MVSGGKEEADAATAASSGPRALPAAASGSWASADSDYGSVRKGY